jgi:hypothetical protein
MKGNWPWLIFLALGVLVLLVCAQPGRRSDLQEVPRATLPLTRNEQAMYYRLAGALPDLVVLSQFSFGAVLAARSTAARNAFNRKRADFVICEKSFKVVAIVELDDSSQDGNESRDSLLVDAGYRVLRYRSIPNIDRVQADFAPPPSSPPPSTQPIRAGDVSARIDPS